MVEEDRVEVVVGTGWLGLWVLVWGRCVPLCCVDGDVRWRFGGTFFW